MVQIEMVHIEMSHIEIEVAVVLWYHTRALWFLHAGTAEHAAQFTVICPRSSEDRAMASEAMRRRFDSYRGYHEKEVPYPVVMLYDSAAAGSGLIM